VGATAGQVLVWNDRIIPAYYFSSSGGRTSAIHDAWPRSPQVPYLVSVSDPYDYISPHHVWPTVTLSAGAVARVLHLAHVTDMQVVENSSSRAGTVRVLTGGVWKQYPAQAIRKKFKLRAMDFAVRALSLDDAETPVVFGTHVRVGGWVRGLGLARLQMLTDTGWTTVRHVHANADGRFSVSLHAV